MLVFTGLRIEATQAYDIPNEIPNGIEIGKEKGRETKAKRKRSLLPAYLCINVYIYILCHPILHLFHLCDVSHLA